MHFPVKVLPWGCWEWSSNETSCEHDHGKVLQNFNSTYNSFYHVLVLFMIVKCFFLHVRTMSSMMASFSEGLLLSEKVGLDPSVLVEVQFKPSHTLLNYPLYAPFNKTPHKN